MKRNARITCLSAFVIKIQTKTLARTWRVSGQEQQIFLPDLPSFGPSFDCDVVVAPDEEEDAPI